VLFYVLFVCKCVLPPGDNPIAVNKYIISIIFRGSVLISREYSLPTDCPLIPPMPVSTLTWRMRKKQRQNSSGESTEV